MGLCAALLLGCKPESRIELQIGDAAIYSVIVLDANGALVSATRLKRIDEASAIASEGASKRLLVGWSEAAIGGERLAALVGQVPTAAVDCDPRLPSPSAVYAIEGDQLVDAITATLPRLTVPAWAPGCPTEPGLSVHLEAEHACIATPCWPTVFALSDPCRYEITFPGATGEAGDLEASCGLASRDPLVADPSLFARVESDGGLCIEPQPGWACERFGRSARCLVPEKACPVILSPFVADQSPIFEAAVTAAVGTPGEILGNVLAAPVYNRGVLRDLLPLERETVVIHRGDVGGPTCSLDCGPGCPEARFHFLDAEDLRSTRTASAGLCASRLWPSSDGFWASYVLDDAWRLGRYDASGARIDSIEVSPVSIPFDARPGCADPDQRHACCLESGTERYAECHDAVELWELPEAGAHVMLLAARDAGPSADAQLIVIDTAASSVRRRFDLDIHPTLAVPLGGGRLLLLDPDRQEAFDLDVESGTLDGPVLVRSPIDDYFTLMRPLVHEGQIFVPADSYLYTMMPEPPLAGVIGTTVIHDYQLRLVGLHPWPGGTGHDVLVIGVTDKSNGHRPSVGSLYDPTTRQIRPGHSTLGERVITRVRTDARGRVWMMMPDVAKVTRVTPR